LYGSLILRTGQIQGFWTTGCWGQCNPETNQIPNSRNGVSWVWIRHIADGVSSYYLTVTFSLTM